MNATKPIECVGGPCDGYPVSEPPKHSDTMTYIYPRDDGTELQHRYALDYNVADRKTRWRFVATAISVSTGTDARLVFSRGYA